MPPARNVEVIGSGKNELEDLSFQTLYPKVYDEIVRLVAERPPAREEFLAGVREQVRRLAQPQLIEPRAETCAILIQKLVDIALRKASGGCELVR